MADRSKPFFSAEIAHQKAKPPYRKPHPLTPESKFWRSFKNSELASGLILPVTSLDFSPVPPFDLVAACSASVHIFDGASLSPKPNSPLSSFSDVAYSPSFRCDGALLAAGGETGQVQIFNPLRSGHAIRRLHAHSRPVHLVRFPRAADKLHLFSAGDDALLSYWDVSTESSLLSFTSAHRDYIRAGCPSPASADLIATGSYDHSIKFWDVRVSPESNPVSSFTHGSPVESVLFFPSGGLLATAGGNSVKIWDAIGGGRLIHTMESHNKTVTSLCLGRVGNANVGTGESRLLSVSIDGYMKVFDYAAFKITHTLRYPAQLLSVGFSPSGLFRAIGTSNGVIYAGKKKIKKEDDSGGQLVKSEIDGFVPEPERRVLRPTNFRYFQRGQGDKPSETDYIVKKTKKVRLAEHDVLLKKFRHREALVSALNTRRLNSVVAVMEELVARKKLIKCIANLDVNELGLLLGFLHKNATKPRHARFLLGLAKRVVEMRGEDIQSSEELRCHVQNLRNMISEEMKIQRSLLEIQGMISPLLLIAGR
ncbi:Coatomer subunit beta'-3 [Apostasia shenzhenica]|uniref:Coatomer subunit beta'-3 n=1 Tax=Apostasia shenzhenica TaxID=1088818 RepID=A0A2I0AXN5_9ASPA|nr:Coatomer subunit beta'-3 [Apostasia shenzhenica]